MVCTIFTRLFAWVRRQAPTGREPLSTPASCSQLPFAIPITHTIETSGENAQLEKAVPVHQIDNLELSVLAFEGSCTLILQNILHSESIAAFLETTCASQGYLSHEVKHCTENSDCFDLFLHYSTAMEASHAAISQAGFTQSNGAVRRLAPYHVDETEDEQPPLKRVKTGPSVEIPKQCLACCELLSEDYSEPCTICQQSWCYECMAKRFTTALGDPDSFPARCCDRILHYDVVRGRIAEDQLQKYKDRFEQHHAEKPVYCASPRCSTFLPPRLAKPDAKGQVKCVTCDLVTCSKCKCLVDDKTPKHYCTQAKDQKKLLKRFGYKQCPRCDVAISRMYGCSHVRCTSCGSHWCWDCQRPINICWAKPCESNREDDYESEEEVEEVVDESSESTDANEADATARSAQDQETAIASVLTTDVAQEVTPIIEAEQRTIAHGHVTAMAAMIEANAGPNSTAIGGISVSELLQQQDQADEDITSDNDSRPETVTVNDSATQTADEPFVNLDDPDAEAWEDYDNWDFGEEPTTEGHDTWGCLHSYTGITEAAFWTKRKHWLPSKAQGADKHAHKVKEIECLECYQTITSTQQTAVNVEKQVAGAGDSQETLTASVPEVPTSQDKKGKKKKSQPQPRLYVCFSCGVCHCFDCKRQIDRKQKALLKKRTSD